MDAVLQAFAGKKIDGEKKYLTKKLSDCRRTAPEGLKQR
jgi:hypothetical protein